MVTNMVISQGDRTPSQALLGFHPRDLYGLDSVKLDSYTSAIETSPDLFESAVRHRLQAKQDVLQAIVEERIARAHNTKVEQRPLQEYLPGTEIEFYKLPDKKDQLG